MRRLALGVVIVICAFWGVASLTFPLGWDQAIMASVGDVVLQGGMPYRDAWDMKGPVAYLWYAAAQLVFGRGQFGIRVFDLALLLAASLALASAVARVTRPSVKPWAAAALILCYASMSYFHTAQADGAVALLLTLAFSPLLRSAPKPRHVVLAGLAVGIAALVKPLFLVFLFMPVWAAIRREGPRAPHLKSELALTAAAAAAPIVITLFWFSARGALGALIDVHIRFAAGYSEVFQTAIRDRSRGLARYFLQLPQGPALVLAIFGAAVMWRRTQPIARLTIAWFLAGLAIVVLQRKFFGYHWSILFPPGILLAATGIDELVAPRDGAPRSNGRAILGLAGSVLVFVALAAGPTRDVAHFARYAAGLDDRGTYYGGFRHEDNDFCAGDEMAAAEYVKAHTTDTDRIAIFGYDAPVLYLSGRQNATRFSFPLALVGWRSTKASRTEYQREFMNALRDPPTYLVVGLLFPTREQAFGDFPGFDAYLERSYTKERSFGVVDLYRRK
jgi:4-amino-4-deoxy-L-arabinose transferase-like glycosyltransferase